MEDIRPGQSIVLVLVKAPSGKLRFYSPWEGAATVPLSNQAIPIVLGSLGDSAALKNPMVLGTLAEVIGARTRLDIAKGRWDLYHSDEELNRVSQECGLDPAEIDRAIRRLATGIGIQGSPTEHLEARRYVDVMSRGSEGHT